MNQSKSAADKRDRNKKAGTASVLPLVKLSLCALAMLTAVPHTLSAQDNLQRGAEDHRTENKQTEDKRILWIFTNHRTTDEDEELTALTAKGKFAIAFGDATDPAIFAQTALLSGLGQLTNSNPSFGQGAAGYGKRFGTTYGDFAIENLTTEGIFPAILHQDPRYFRRGQGSTWSRIGYAMSRLLITRTDSGKNQFNSSEIVGAAASVALSNAYYPDGRTVGNNVGKYGVQLGFDAASNVLKEFWPDLKRHLPRRLVPH